MTDDLHDVPASEQPTETPRRQYVEEVVEYVDNRRQRAVLAGLLVLLFLLLLGTAFWVVRLTRPAGAPAANANLPGGMQWVRSIYGWGKGAKQQLTAPTDVAVAGDGTIWALSEHAKIIAFNPEGKVVRVITPKTGASLEGIDVDENGDLYVADFGGQIIHFSPTGSVVATYQVQTPTEVDVKDGKIAVTSARGVAVFVPGVNGTQQTDKVLLQMGSRGQGKDQFDLPHGIIQTNDRIYVSDTQNRRVKAYDAAGKPLWMLGDAPNRKLPGAGDIRSKDASNGPFELPTGMTLDGKGRIVVLDAFKFQIIEVDPQTHQIARDSQKKLMRYGDQGSADGYFQYPTGIAYDKTRDWFVVADTGNHRLQIVRLPDSGGSPLSRVIGAFSVPMCVFLIPLILLVLAVVVAVSRRRRELKREPLPNAA